MHISIVDDKTEEKKRSREEKKKRGEERSITFMKPNAQNLLKIGYQPT
jgi:hypothetical protein